MLENSDDPRQVWRLSPAEAHYKSCCTLRSVGEGKGQASVLMYPISLLQGTMVIPINSCSHSIKTPVPWWATSVCCCIILMQIWQWCTCRVCSHCPVYHTCHLTHKTSSFLDVTLPAISPSSPRTEGKLDEEYEGSALKSFVARCRSWNVTVLANKQWIEIKSKTKWTTTKQKVQF